MHEWYAVKVAGVFGLVLVAALPRVRAHHPFDRFGPANFTTTFRALLVACTAGLVGEPHTFTVASAAIALTAVTTALDGVDGWLARRTRMASTFGARFDMEVDALLILVLAILTWQHAKAGGWILASGLLRYLFVAAGWRWRWFERELPPSIRRKTVCVFQIAALVIALVPWLRSPVSDAVAACSLALLVWSFAVDVRWLWERRDETNTAGATPVERVEARPT